MERATLAAQCLMYIRSAIRVRLQTELQAVSVLCVADFACPCRFLLLLATGT
jgi:hypothetical protein